MTQITQEDLNKRLWAAADSSRTALDGGIYKDYALAILFFKYLSDLSKKQYDKYRERFGDDTNRIEEKMKSDRFLIMSTVFRNRIILGKK